jgi:mono/diheme cytochrome c family protein
VPGLLILALGGLLRARDVSAQPAPDAARGAAIATVARCAACHTAPGGTPLAGGYAIVTRFGTFYGTNLTADPEHGLGAWTEADFFRAVRHGRSPDGRPYYPAFPYPSFTRLTDADLHDVWAWLRTVPPDPSPNRPHDLHRAWRGRWILGVWQLLELRVGPVEADRSTGGSSDTSDPATLARGAYLVDAVGHCGECHTPRDALGGLRRHRALEGSDTPPEPAPDITPGGLAGWTRADVASFLADGMAPDGDFAGGGMHDVIRDGTARLSAADRDAIAAWLLAMPVRPGHGVPTPLPAGDTAPRADYE